MIDRGLIGDHYWIINGYGGVPDLAEQIQVAEGEIADYIAKQEFAKTSWNSECWAEQDKLYEFWLYKNMQDYWERVLKTLKADGGTPPAEEVELELENLEESGIKIPENKPIGRFVDLTGDIELEHYYKEIEKSADSYYKERRAGASWDLNTDLSNSQFNFTVNGVYNIPEEERVSASF
jgi:hypothetical protein